jgi:hypothetical protein
MDQARNAFVPHILIVQTGTPVLFPDNDAVGHHVNSFSATKSFELPVYKGNAHPLLWFEKPGFVVLGCNSHDGMLGYILVVDTPLYSLADASGTVTLESLPSGGYTLASGDLTPEARRFTGARVADSRRLGRADARRTDSTPSCCPSTTMEARAWRGNDLAWERY